MGYISHQGEYKCYPTRCGYCRQQIFYYENERGSKVFFDSLGPPWPKHRCAQYTDSQKSSHRKSDGGWLKIENGSEIRPSRNRRNYTKQPAEGIAMKVASHV